MRPSLNLAYLLTPEPLHNGDVGNYLKLWEFARKFASTPSTHGPHGPQAMVRRQISTSLHHLY